MAHVVRGNVCTYPGGGAWGVRCEDDIGSFPVLPGWERGQRFQLRVDMSPEEREDKIALLPDVAQKFVRAVRSLEHIGAYMLLQGGSFSVSIRNHHELTGTERYGLLMKIAESFSQAYGPTLQLVRG